MKKSSYIIAVLGTAFCLTGCRSVENIPSAQTDSNVSAVSITSITSVTTTAVSYASASTASTSLSAAPAVTENTASPVTAVQAQAAVEQPTPPAGTDDLPVIYYAELIAEYNDYGDGYKYRLETNGDFEYWDADIKGISAGQELNFSVTSKALDDFIPYITCGSTITELSAVVTPYGSNGKAGTPVSITWDRNNIVHEAERFFGSNHDTANVYGFYPYSEAARDYAGNIRVKDIEGQWLHGQYTLYFFGCDKVSGLYTDQDESGSYAGTVYLEYNISGNNIYFWYNLYDENGTLFKSFRASSGLPANNMNNELNGEVMYTRIKATPHRTCAEDAPTDFSSDCIEIPQAYWSVGQPLCQRC